MNKEEIKQLRIGNFKGYSREIEKEKYLSFKVIK
jgi:hypothetical protein